MKHLNVILFLSTIVLIMSCASCAKDEKQDTPTPIINDPHFTITSHQDAGLENFTRKVEVFGVAIYAVPEVEEAKLLHAAHVMAQYLDNDEDGTVDNQLVVDKMLENKAFVVMWKNENELDLDPPSDREGQDLGNDETHPLFVANGKTGEFDAPLEEVLHIITHAGYAFAYPEIFGEEAGTSLSNAMDIARGGHFTSIPNVYPNEAWYSYDDETCEYNCQTTEYLYWSLTSLLGAQENRIDDIGHEWKLNTPALVESTDVAIYELLTNPDYKFPTVLPDGTYRGE